MGRADAFWLASRGVQQMDLAVRFSEAALSRDLPVLALKGIAIVDELYGGAENRPMADIDFLVVDSRRFEEAAEVARSLGLVETGAGDHALVFKERASGVVLELHFSLTSCPGLFTVDHQAAWSRRVPVASTSMFRLADEDLLLHLALHTAFQHGFVAGEYHYRDFQQGLATFKPPAELVLTRAREWGALGALGAMVVACRNRSSGASFVNDSLPDFESHCPKMVRRWLEARSALPARMSLWSLARIRFALAPSGWTYLRLSVFPGVLPGQTLSRRGAVRRLATLAGASLPASPSAPPASLPERTPAPEIAEGWIREALRLDPAGAQLTVSGTCMEPSLREGSRITLKSFGGSVRVGDVVLLRTAAGLRLHRVLLRFGDRIRTKGDQGAYLDPASTSSAILGVCEVSDHRWTRLARVVRSLGRLLARPWTAPGRGDAAHARLLP